MKERMQEIIDEQKPALLENPEKFIDDHMKELMNALRIDIMMDMGFADRIVRSMLAISYLNEKVKVI